MSTTRRQRRNTAMLLLLASLFLLVSFYRSRTASNFQYFPNKLNITYTLVTDGALNDTGKVKPQELGCFAYLIDPAHVNEFSLSIKNLLTNLAAKQNYTIVVFYEKSPRMHPIVIKEILKMIRISIQIPGEIRVTLSDISQREVFKKPAMSSTCYRSYPGYCRMIMFWMEAIPNSTTLANFKYSARIDSDNYFTRYLNGIDIFEEMDANRADYGYVKIDIDLPGVTRHLKEYALSYTKLYDKDYLFETNFEVLRLEAFRRFRLRSDYEPSVWKYRWGDAVLRYINVLAFNMKTHQFCSIVYEHQGTKKVDNRTERKGPIESNC